LELAQQLARRGHFIIFLSTPRNITTTRPVPPELSPSIRFVSLPLPAVDGLLDGAEWTSDVPPEKAELLKVAFDGLASPFAGFLTAACAAGGEGHGKKPDWVVVDFAHNWLPPIAGDHKARRFTSLARLLPSTEPQCPYCSSLAALLSSSMSSFLSNNQKSWYLLLRRRQRHPRPCLLDREFLLRVPPWATAAAWRTGNACGMQRRSGMCEMQCPPGRGKSSIC
ncbi:hypothetical protein BAE44_0015545, partial [Dichanthelium oligosanthes]